MACCSSSVTNQIPQSIVDNVESLVTTILEGEQVENNLSQKLNDLLTHGAARIKLTSEDPNDNASGTVFERIQRAKAGFDRDSVQALLAPYGNYFGKSSELSLQFRERGNALYKNRKVEGALRAYTLAVAFAPTDGNKKTSRKGNLLNEELLLAYTNRSAVLLQRNDATAALNDIEKALKILEVGKCKTIPNLKEKLHERKVKCEQIIKSGVTSAPPDADVPPEIDIMRSHLFKVENPSKNIPNAESFVEIKYSPERGRHLTVKKDVTAGSVLLVDQPFVSVLNKLLRWETEHCHNCSQGMVNGIPCLSCSFALFCSEECRDAATRKGGIHHLEHKYLPILHCLDSNHGEIQSLRILATVPKKEMLELSENLKSPPGNGTLPGFDKKGIYNRNSYLPIFHLISHPPSSSAENNEDSLGEAIMNALTALFLKEILKMYTIYFENETSDIFEDLVASLILKHLESIKYNAISISKLVASGRNSKSAVAYAAAVYPLISLCNHSCDPNCAPVKQSKHLVTSLVALKHLKAGDELFITYKPLYTQLKTSERQKFLAERYRFICNCQPCEQNWGPGMIQRNTTNYEKGAMLILQPSRCEKCHGGGGNNDKLEKVKQCHECALKDLGRAKEIQEMESVLFECHDSLIGMGEAKTSGSSGSIECLKRLPEVVDYFGREGFLSYFPLYNVALDLLKRALVQTVS